jgi:hypothetical protein
MSASRFRSNLFPKTASYAKKEALVWLFLIPNSGYANKAQRVKKGDEIVKNRK